MQRIAAACFVVFMMPMGCGSVSNPPGFQPSVATQTPPFVKRVAPSSGKEGDTITIFGFGFSSNAGENVIIVAGKGTTAESYGLADPPSDGEVEFLTFKVPAGATLGSGGISVTVFENTSNNDIQFTINP